MSAKEIIEAIDIARVGKCYISAPHIPLNNGKFEGCQNYITVTVPASAREEVIKALVDKGQHGTFDITPPLVNIHIILAPIRWEHRPDGDVLLGAAKETLRAGGQLLCDSLLPLVKEGLGNKCVDNPVELTPKMKLRPLQSKGNVNIKYDPDNSPSSITIEIRGATEIAKERAYEGRDWITKFLKAEHPGIVGVLSQYDCVYATRHLKGKEGQETSLSIHVIPREITREWSGRIATTHQENRASEVADLLRAALRVSDITR